MVVLYIVYAYNYFDKFDVKIERQIKGITKITKKSTKVIDKLTNRSKKYNTCNKRLTSIFSEELKPFFIFI